MTATQSSFGIELPDEKFAKPQNLTPGAANATPEDLYELIREAFNNPLDFPKFLDSVFPGDKLAVVLHTGLPQPERILSAIARYLATTALDPKDVSYLSAYQLNETDEGQGVHVHDPDDEQKIAYIAANLEGQPVLVNRVLFDADVILPVCCATTMEGDSTDCIYPEFSSTETKTRYREQKASQNSRATEIETANNGLGIFQSLQLVAGPGGKISNAVFGQAGLAKKQAFESSLEIWTLKRTTGSQVVVATIEALPKRQGWGQVFQAIVAANRLAPDCDQLVLLCNLNDKPKQMTRAVLQLQFESDTESINRVLRKATETQKEVAEIVREKTVYLKSELPESVVESVGLGYIKTDDELQRLLDKFDAGVLLRDAHFCRVEAGA